MGRPLPVVIARNSSFTHQGKPADTRQVGRGPGVRYVAEGSIRESSARVRAPDPGTAAALAAAAWAYSTLGFHFEQSLELANRALALHPNWVQVRSFCGWVFNSFGQSLKAAEQFEEARRLSPVDPKGYFLLLGLAAAHCCAEDFEETVMPTGRILADVPSHNVARRCRAAG